MISKWMLAAAPLFALATPLHAQTAVWSNAERASGVTPDDLMRHIKVLASDEFEGRKPGTESEGKTLLYIASQFHGAGLEPAAGDGRWYQSVGLVERKPFASRVIWPGDDERQAFDADDFILLGRGPIESVSDAPIYFVGHGLVMPEAGIDQLAGADLDGAIVFLRSGQPQGVEDAPGYEARVATLVARGAAAVIGVMPEQANWANVVAYGKAGTTRLQSDAVPRIAGLAPSSVVAALIGEETLPGADVRSFAPVRLDGRASLDVSTIVRPYISHNVVGRLRGTGTSRESVLFLGHWDHLGICRPEGAADRICNGAVDNASGIAMLIESARHLARDPRPTRDILFLATTAEEMGLLGAEAFAADPVVPLDSIVAAINMDTVAIAPKGEPVATIGRGTTEMDPLIEEISRALGRAVDADTEANVMIQRQDGWALARAGVPTVMVGGSFSDMAKLQAFLGDPYHKPNDDLDAPIELGGAAEDTELLVALGRKLADLDLYDPKRN